MRDHRVGTAARQAAFVKNLHTGVKEVNE